MKVDEEGKKVVASNRKARHEFEIMETFEAGLVLGSSVTGASLETSVPLSFIIHGHIIATGGAAAFFSWLYLTFQKTGA